MEAGIGRVEGRENERGRKEDRRKKERGGGNRRWRTRTGRKQRTKRAKASWDRSKSVWGRAEKWFWLMRP